MEKIMFGFLFFMFAISLALAGNETQSQQGLSEEGIELRLQERLQNGTSLSILGKEVKVKSEAGKDLEIEVDGIRARSKMNLSQDNDGEANRTSLKVEFSNGNNGLIKIMPDTASQRAIERLELKVCRLEEGCQIELKEVGENNQTRATYEIKAKKEGKLLGVFKTKINVEAQVDAETGEIIKTRKSWWAFLASE